MHIQQTSLTVVHVITRRINKERRGERKEAEVVQGNTSHMWNTTATCNHCEALSRVISLHSIYHAVCNMISHAINNNNELLVIHFANDIIEALKSSQVTASQTLSVRHRTSATAVNACSVPVITGSICMKAAIVWMSLSKSRTHGGRTALSSSRKLKPSHWKTRQERIPIGCDAPYLPHELYSWGRYSGYDPRAVGRRECKNS